MGAALLFSCNKDFPKAEHLNGEPVFQCMLNRAITDNNKLRFSLYIFTRSSADQPFLLDSIIETLRPQSKLVVPFGELISKDYRLLFLATSPTIPEISISPCEKLTVWNDIRLISLHEKISTENYYQVVDLCGKDILEMDTIKAQLTRCVGLPVIDFVKKRKGTEQIEEIDTSCYGSIFDRIYKMEVTYYHVPVAIFFDENKETYTVNTKDSVKQIIHLQQEADYKVKLPQQDVDTLPGMILSGGRIKGLCCLPGTNMKIKLVIYYYDTTPLCGMPIHQHTTGCYELKNIELQLPQGIPIQANTYTVNTARITSDRIVDIQFFNTLNFITDWKTE